MVKAEPYSAKVAPAERTDGCLHHRSHKIHVHFFFALRAECAQAFLYQKSQRRERPTLPRYSNSVAAGVMTDASKLHSKPALKTTIDATQNECKD